MVSLVLKNSDFIYRSKTLILGVFRAKTRNYENFTFQLRFVNVKFLQKMLKRFSVEIHV